MKAKRGQIAVWGSHTDESGIVTRIKGVGFYARYKSIHPSVPGGRTPVYHSRFFRNDQLVECTGYPPSGKVKVVNAQ